MIIRGGIFLLLLLLSPLSPHPSVAFAEGFLAQQAQLAWQDRDKPGKTEEATKIWEQAVKAEPGRADLWVALSKALGRAVRHAKTSKERREWADRAREAAEKAVAKDSSSSDAYAVYGEALGQWANVHKGVRSLKAVRQAVDALNKSIKLNPENSYAHMLLASFYREAPNVISVGDKDKALQHARLAVIFGRTYAINRLVLAKALLDKGDKAMAIAELQFITGLTPPADAIPETAADQETAAAMLKSMGIVLAGKTDTHPPQASPHCGEAAGVCTEQP